jgi:DNA (cytosine-5)-methyltransferase 1
MTSTSSWIHRKANSDEERFGLLDNPKMIRYKKMPIFQEPIGELPSMRPFTAMGVTSGVGSMLIGCDRLGFKVVGNIEWRDYYRYRSADGNSTFPKHFSGAFMARGIKDVPANMMPGSIDFILGHPECGRFSSLSHSVSLGSYKESRASDVSDIPLFLKMMAEFKPKFFLMDDLPASFDALPMSEYVRLLPDYDLYPEWISNWGYGNIQKYRNRMFIVGALKSENFVFRPGEFEHTTNLKDVIEDLLGITPGELENSAHPDPEFVPARYANMRHYGDRSSWAELTELFKTQDWGKNIRYYSPDGEAKIRPGTTNPKWDSFCPVLSGGYNPIHPIEHRPFTIRERARIQGFPDDFIFFHDEEGPNRKTWEPYGSDGQRGIKQTGKAMPIQFCEFVADQVLHHLEGKTFASTGQRVIKANPKVTQAKEDFCRLGGYSDQSGACSACWHRAECPLFLDLKTEGQSNG